MLTNLPGLTWTTRGQQWKFSFTDIIIFHTFRKHLMEVGLDKGSGWFFSFLSKAQHYLRLEFSGKLGCVLYSLYSEKVSKLFHPKIKFQHFALGLLGTFAWLWWWLFVWKLWYFSVLGKIFVCIYVAQHCFRCHWVERVWEYYTMYSKPLLKMWRWIQSFQ